MRSKKHSTIQSRNRNRGIQNERDLAEDFNDLDVPARRVPLSGAIPGLGGDVESEQFSGLWEAKVLQTRVCIGEKQISGARYVQLDLNWLDKIEKHAQDRKFRHAAVIFRGRNLRRRYVILGFEEYVSLLKHVP